MKLANALMNALWIALFACSLSAQTVTVGLEVGMTNATVSGDVSTNVSLDNPATANGTITTVTFGWSSGCADAAKIKFFRRSGNTLTMTAERGPFPAYWIKNNTVTLSPPVPVQAGDLIAIARITTASHCGYPQGQVGETTNGFIAFASDVTGSVSMSTGTTWTYPLALFGMSSSSSSGFVQKGPKLVGTGAVGPSNAQVVKSVALSTDGNTAIVVRSTETYVWSRSGGIWAQQTKLVDSGVGSASLSGDGNTAIVGVGGENSGENSGAAAAWIWTRSGELWTQQEPKLVGLGAVGTSFQGASVALSADGNTAIVGAPSDNNNAGAAWIWTRSAGVWTQQGSKLHGSSNAAGAQQGSFVSLSADGNTAIVGGRSSYNDTPAEGAWVWTRSGGVWTQQGIEMVGSGAGGQAYQGNPVALSADGNTAIVGAPNDNGNAGAAWIWTRSGGSWTQQGNKMVSSDGVGASFQGCSVSLSGDGNTAFIGGYGDNNSFGATWVWTRTSGAWSQHGSKLLGSGVAGTAQQGNAAALSGDGNTAIIGGNGAAGPVWIWTRSAGNWAQQGDKLVGSGGAGIRAWQGYSVALSADANTAIVGGVFDSNGIGAAWIWTRSAEDWTQEGKLSDLSAVSSPGGFNVYQGQSVALSADGNTAIVGGPTESSSRDRIGAAWVWTRSGTVWTQQQKLVGSDSVGTSFQGESVGLSADGNTAVVGGYGDNDYVGAAWVFTRSGRVWTQQGPKLVGSGATTCVGQGCSSGAAQGGAVALSADGNTAIVGGFADNPLTPPGLNFLVPTGAAWVWTRSAGVWTQQGGKLVAPDNDNTSRQGESVALAADGNTALVGAGGGGGGVSVAWAWTRTGTSWTKQAKLIDSPSEGGHGRALSLSADGNTALLADADVGEYSRIWTRSGGVWTRQDLLVGTGEVGFAAQGTSACLSGDGNTAIIGGWSDNDYVGAVWIFVRPGPPRRRAVMH